MIRLTDTLLNRDSLKDDKSVNLTYSWMNKILGTGLDVCLSIDKLLWDIHEISTWIASKNCVIRSLLSRSHWKVHSISTFDTSRLIRASTSYASTTPAWVAGSRVIYLASKLEVDMHCRSPIA